MKKFVFLFGVFSLGTGPVFACDLCAMHTVRIAEGEGATGYYAYILHQSTKMSTFLKGSRTVLNPFHESVRGTLSQFLVSKTSKKGTVLQSSVPLVYKEFTRVNGTALQKGKESGVGDIRISVSWRIKNKENRSRNAQVIRWVTGLRLPSGSTSRLKEFTLPPSRLLNLSSVRSGSHSGHTGGARVGGQELAVGEGSIGLFFGPDVYFRTGRTVSRAQIQYTVNTKGTGPMAPYPALQWKASLGRFLSLHHNKSLQLGLGLLGERALGYRGLALEPAISWTSSHRLSGELAMEIPLEQSTKGLTLVPNKRIKAGLSWKF